MTSSLVASSPQRAVQRDQEIALDVTDLGKQYRIGESARVHSLLAERLNAGVHRLLTHGPRGRRASRDDEETILWALRHVSFTVRFGEVIGIIGPNGAGKSTLLKLLSRISSPTEGRIVANGRLATLLEVGTGFHPELTGRENIYLNGTLLGMRRREIAAKFDEIVLFSGVERFLDTPVKRYSSGMYVRLAFAVAAHLEPEVLLLDEVLSVGDAEFQRRCFEKMRNVTGEGRAVVFVSHGLNTVQEICQRVMLLEHGRVRMIADPETAVAAYLDDFQPDVILGDDDSILVPPDVLRESSGEAALRSLRLNLPIVRGAFAASFGHRLDIDLEFDFAEDVDDAVFELGISTADGRRVVTVHSTDDAREPLVVLRGRHRMRVSIPVTFIPGEYAVDVAVHHATAKTIDSVGRVARFHALNGPGDGDRYPWALVRGHVRPDSRWSTDGEPDE